MYLDAYITTLVFQTRRVSKVAQEYNAANVYALETPNFFSSDVRGWLTTQSKYVLNDSNINESFAAEHLPYNGGTYFNPTANGHTLSFIDLTSSDPILLITQVKTNTTLPFKTRWIPIIFDKRYTYSSRNKVMILLRDVPPGTSVTVEYITAAAWFATRQTLQGKAPLGASLLAKVRPVIWIFPIGTMIGTPDEGRVNEMLKDLDTITTTTFADIMRSAGAISANFSTLHVMMFTLGGGIKGYVTSEATKSAFYNYFPHKIGARFAYHANDNAYYLL